MQIKFKLSEDGIDDAIKKIEAYKQQVQAAPAKLTELVTDEGAKLAQENVPVDSGDLQSSIHAEAYSESGRIVANAAHAAYVEFGTGIVGAENSHPNYEEFGWVYDVNEHGEDGWWYTGKDGKKHWTKGLQSRPFMYDTSVQLKEKIEQLGKEALKKTK